MTSLPSILPASALPGSDIPDGSASNEGDSVKSGKTRRGKVPTPTDRSRTADSLREALADGLQSPDLIIRASAESARALTGADGVAIALRARGVVVCRARSGELAPPLGSQLSMQSGISGECLRSAVIQSCDDSEHDARVDPEVCRAMGISSIVAVPLRGPIGIAGILEAFSSRREAFKDEQINYLRELALVVEAAYEKERLAQEQETLATLRPPRVLSSILARAVGTKATEIEAPSITSETVVSGTEDGPSGSLPRRYWVLGAATLAVLLVLGVWLSWREPVPEGSSAPTRPQPAAVNSSTAEKPTPALPAGLPRAGTTSKGAKSDSNAGRVLEKAAEVERVPPVSIQETMTSDVAPVGMGKSDGPPAANAGARGLNSNDGAPEPPAVAMSAPTDNAQITGILSESKTLPAIDVRVSQGVTPAELIHKVDPVYPLQARAQRISGSVELEITIGQDGLVHAVREISGEPLLIAAAKQAVRKWRYTPVRLNGKAVQADKRVTVVFRLP